MMKNNYGNLFYDSVLLGTIWKHRITGGELEQKREFDLIEKIKTDRDMHKNDIIPFTYNEIDNIYKLATGFINEWNKVFDFLVNLKKMCNNKDDNLKALAKLYNLSKIIGFNNLNKMLASSMVYCEISLNENSLEKLDNVIYTYSLPNIVMNLLVGLTPNEVYGLFPINKEYNGCKTQTKDYYTCIKEVETIGLNTPMDYEQAENFVMDCNTHTFIFNVSVKLICLISDYKRWDVYDMIENFKKENPRIHIVK